MYIFGGGDIIILSVAGESRGSFLGGRRIFLFFPQERPVCDKVKRLFFFLPPRKKKKAVFQNLGFPKFFAGREKKKFFCGETFQYVEKFRRSKAPTPPLFNPLHRGRIWVFSQGFNLNPRIFGSKRALPH